MAFRLQDLEAYLDESLPAGEMARIEEQLRRDSALRSQLALIHSRRDTGVHSLGEIWRRHRVSCPGRAELGSYLLGAVGDGQREYIQFHLEIVGCRYCQANLADLETGQKQSAETQQRRRRYFQSSAGLLKRP